MLDEDRLSQLLRATFPPVQAQAPRRDLWRLVESRIEESARWSWVDLGLAAVATMVLLIFPGSFLLLAYHL
jgi:hypothetical protein